MPDPRMSRQERLFVLGFAILLICGFGASIIADFEPKKTTALFVGHCQRYCQVNSLGW
jgi:hypothetical protein